MTWITEILIITMLASSMALFGQSFYSTQLLSPSASLDPAHVIAGSHCPGDIVTEKVILTINRPNVLETDITIIDKNTRRIVPGTTSSQPDRSRPNKEYISIPISFEVPDLPPGTYERITAVYARNQSAEPAFFTVEFAVKNSCQ